MACNPSDYVMVVVVCVIVGGCADEEVCFKTS